MPRPCFLALTPWMFQETFGTVVVANLVTFVNQTVEAAKEAGSSTGDRYYLKGGSAKEATFAR